MLIRAELMAQYVRDMKARLREKKIGYKKEFLREILKEIRIKGNSVTLKYKLPLTAGTPPARAKNPRKEEFFTLHQLVDVATSSAIISPAVTNSGARLREMKY